MKSGLDRIAVGIGSKKFSMVYRRNRFQRFNRCAGGKHFLALGYAVRERHVERPYQIGRSSNNVARTRIFGGSDCGAYEKREHIHVWSQFRVRQGFEDGRVLCGFTQRAYELVSRWISRTGGLAKRHRREFPHDLEDGRRIFGQPSACGVSTCCFGLSVHRSDGHPSTADRRQPRQECLVSIKPVLRAGVAIGRLNCLNDRRVITGCQCDRKSIDRQDGNKDENPECSHLCGHTVSLPSVAPFVEGPI